MHSASAVTGAPAVHGPVASVTSVKTPVNNANSGGQNCLMLDDRGTTDPLTTLAPVADAVHRARERREAGPDRARPPVRQRAR